MDNARLESFRNTLHRISGPLPRPATHEIVVLGGRAGEREGQVDETTLELREHRFGICGTCAANRNYLHWREQSANMCMTCRKIGYS